MKKLFQTCHAYRRSMTRLCLIFAFACLPLGFALNASAQNLTTVSASSIQDINGTKLAAGQLCFLVTDQNDNPISVQIGGGGQALKRGYCSPVTSGVATSFTVPNPANTLPSGIYYRVTVKDSNTGQEVLRYAQVSFTGATFNFDGYAPLNLANPAPLSGTSVTGNLSVTGNVATTGAVIGSNIPGSIPGAGSCTNQFVRTLASGAPPTCATVGSADLAASLALTTPNIGAATGTSAVISGILASSGSAGLPATIGSNLYMAGGFGTPHLGKVFVGDGSGWQLDFSKRSGSVTTDLFSFKDSGDFIASGNVFAGKFSTGPSAPPSAGDLALVRSATSGYVWLGSDFGAAIGRAGGTGGANAMIDAFGFVGLSALEGSAPAGIGGNDLIYADSTAHRWKMKNNNGAADVVVGGATTDTLTNKTLASPTINSPTVSSPTIVSPTINTGVSQGSGLKHQRFGATCTTGGADGQQCGTTYTWATPFADANYTASCTLTATTTNSPAIIAIGKTATQIQVIIGGTSAVAASAPGVDCIAMHD